jgi:mono/diheme cytochrome c family protein
MNYYIVIIMLLILSFHDAFAQSSNTFLEGIDWKKTKMRHGLVRRLEKRQFTPAAKKEAVARGKKLYQNNCIDCHGASGKGDGNKAKDYGLKPADLTKLTKVYNHHFLFIQVSKGKDKMPMWEDILSDNEIWDITIYLSTLK